MFNGASFFAFYEKKLTNFIKIDIIRTNVRGGAMEILENLNEDLQKALYE